MACNIKIKLIIIYSLVYNINIYADLEKFKIFMNSMSGNFSEYSNNKLISSGKFLLKKPDRFYWEIFKPNHQILSADSQKLYNYDLDLEQITISDLDKHRDIIPLFVLNHDIKQLNKQYKIQALENNFIQLTPILKDLYINNIKLKINNNNLEQIIIANKNNTVNKVIFSKQQYNHHISNSIFKLVVPDNIDIIYE